MDLSTTFDTVDHLTLLDILENRFGITETALSWFRTYLQPRFCKVCINKSYSKPQDLAFQFHKAAVQAPYCTLPMQAPWKISPYPTYAYMDMQMTMV